MKQVRSEFEMTHDLFLEYVRYCEYASKRAPNILAMVASALFCLAIASPLALLGSDSRSFMVTLALAVTLGLVFGAMIVYNLVYLIRREPPSWGNDVERERLCALYLKEIRRREGDVPFKCLSTIDNGLVSLDAGTTVLSKGPSGIRWVRRTESFLLVGCYSCREVMKANWQWRSYFDRDVLKGIPAIPFKLDTLEDGDVDEIGRLISEHAPRALPRSERMRLARHKESARRDALAAGGKTP